MTGTASAMAEAGESAKAEPANALTPLVVDLDGTLLRTDTLFETIALNLFRRPTATVGAMLGVFGGRSVLKARLAALELPQVDFLPARDAFVEFLKAEKDKGRELHLATAADQRIAAAIAQYFRIFDSFEGSTLERNLKGGRKLDALRERFPNGFVYAGDSRADLPVWHGAGTAILAGASPALARDARAAGVNIEAEFPEPSRSSANLWRRALRLHQWSKNALLFAPLVLAHLYFDAMAVLSVLAAFLILGIVASGTYVLNDLSDLESDRRHRTKFRRPFASGDLAVSQGLIVAPILIVVGVSAAFLLKPGFGYLLIAYLCTTLSYSFGLKRVPMLDVFILGLLYTLRLLMGVAVIGVSLSPWLTSFAFFFFFSMSLAKRHVELVNAGDAPPKQDLPGRGYRPEDAPLTLAMGAATTAASLLILVLYLTDEVFTVGSYSSPEFLWSAPALVTIWSQRIWLLANRGELDDDPVAFALRDKWSIMLGVVLAVCFALAVVV